MIILINNKNNQGNHAFNSETATIIWLIPSCLKGLRVGDQVVTLSDSKVSLTT